MFLFSQAIKIDIRVLAVYWTDTSMKPRREIKDNLFSMLIPRTSFHCKLGPVQYGGYEYGLYNVK